MLGCYGLDAERGGLNLIRCWVVVDPDAERGGSARGRVDSMQCQGIASAAALGAVRVPCQGLLPGCGIVMLPHCRARGTVWAWRRDVARARRCETRAVPRVWALARVSCRVIAFS